MRQRTKPLGRINVPGYVCERCGHIWTKRGPKRCDQHIKEVLWLHAGERGLIGNAHELSEGEVEQNEQTQERISLHLCGRVSIVFVKVILYILNAGIAEGKQRAVLALGVVSSPALTKAGIIIRQESRRR